MIRFVIIISFLFFISKIQAQKNDYLTVYSAIGNIFYTDSNKQKDIYSFQKLERNNSIYLEKNAKLFFLASDKKMYFFQKSGKYTISEILSSINKSGSEYSKTMDLIKHYFIETGKFWNKENKTVRLGAVIRGIPKNWVVFPADTIFIFGSTSPLSLTPVFYDSLIVDGAKIKARFSKINIANNIETVINIVTFSKGDAIQLKTDWDDKYEYSIRFEYRDISQAVKLNLPTKSEFLTMQKFLSNLKKQFNNTSNANYLLYEARYFESCNYFINALSDYDALLKIDPDNENYKAMRENCFSSLFNR